MTRRTQVIIGIVALGAGVYVLGRLLRSDEARIRDLIDSMAEGFNDASPSTVVEGLDESFVEAETRLGRAEVHNVLRVLALTARDEATRTFKHRVEVERVETRVAPDGQSASTRVQARFFELRGEEFAPVWEVEIEGELRRTPDWKITRSRSRTVSGKRIY